MTPGTGPVLSVAGQARLDSRSAIVITLPGNVPSGTVIPVLSARLVSGAFGSVSVATAGYGATARYDLGGVSVRITRA